MYLVSRLFFLLLASVADSCSVECSGATAKSAQHHLTQCFIQAFAPGGRVWGGADEPLPSMGSGAKPKKFFLHQYFPGGQNVRPGGKAPRANA
jgi:hypothetical protein